MSAPEGFLTRWSKRKRAIEAPATDEPAGNEAQRPATGATELSATDPLSTPSGLDALMPAQAPDIEAEFDVSTLPSIESLTGTSDLSAFMQKGVPEALKNAALRHAWALDPVIRDYRGPVDYAWDFNDPLAMPGFSPLAPDFDTAEMMRRIMGDPAEVKEEPPAEMALSGSQQEDGAALPDTGHHGAAGADSEPVAEEVGGADPGFGIAALTEAKSPDESAVQKSDPDEIAEENTLRPVGRRHGGALPL